MSATPATRPYFFISYAHLSGPDDGYVRRFYDDLRYEVGVHAGVSHQDIGFCDTRLRAGEQWSPALVEALRTCQVLLALCTPRYFTSPACGKEWAIFTRRLDALRRVPGGSPPSLIPLLWLRMEMPPIVAPYQYKDHSFGEPYARHGLRDLVRLPDHDGDYLRFVTVLAQRIVDLNKLHEIPPERRRPEFDAVESAFHPPETGGSRVRPPDPPPKPKPPVARPRQEPPKNLPRLNPNPPEDDTAADLGGEP